MRFFAAFYVAIYHLHYFSKIDAGWLNRFLSNGDIAVDFFFILSGFVLTHTYLNEMHDGKFSFPRFIVKRLARIYPVHFVTLIISILLIWVVTQSGGDPYSRALDGGNFVKNVLLIHGWGTVDMFSYNMPSWSVSAELFAYFLFPLFLAFIPNQSTGKILALSVIVFLGVYFIVFFKGSVLLTSYNPYLALPRIMTEFVMGICVYMFFSKYSLHKKIMCEDLFSVVVFVYTALI